VSKTFADLGLPHELVSPLRKAGIENPFPIQAATIPDALNGRDVLGRAPTGSGKTLAFGLPLLATVRKAQPHKPRSLILSPTRELAEQIRKELAPVAAGRGLRLLTVYGGVSYHPQRSKLRSGVDVLIACPGRLQDLIEQGDVSLEAAEYVVVDEADRMADMGFMPQVRKLLDMTPSRRQTVLFSATLDGDVAELTRLYQTDPVRHEVGADGHDSGDARHHFWRVEHSDRLSLVADVVGSHGSTLVFTRTRRGADRLARQLQKHGVEAETIHGGRSQRQRDRALRHFKDGQAEALIATDVAARGIHVDGVECVVHFDPPEDHKAYLHRSGRTARAGAQGHVVSFIQHDQVKGNYRLQDTLGLSGALGSPSVEALLDGGGEQLGKRSGDARRSRPEASGGSRPHNSGGRRNNNPRSGRPQGNRKRRGVSQSAGGNRADRSPSRRDERGRAVSADSEDRDERAGSSRNSQGSRRGSAGSRSQTGGGGNRQRSRSSSSRSSGSRSSNARSGGSGNSDGSSGGSRSSSQPRNGRTQSQRRKPGRNVKR
jgi:superfamily II DNA/RNA helicase